MRIVTVGTLIFLALVVCACGPRGSVPGGGPVAAAPAPTAAPAPALVRVTGQVKLGDRTNAGGTQVYVPGTPLLSITDDAGNFAIEGLAPGKHHVMARADGYDLAKVGDVTVAATGANGQQQTSYTLAAITLLPRAAAAPTSQGGSIRGRVVLAAGEAGGGAAAPDWTACTVQLDGTAYRTTCAKDGAFLLWSLPPGEYQVVAQLTGYETARQPVTVRNAEVAAEIPLTPSDAGRDRQIRGIVSLNHADGSPANDFDKILVQVDGHPDLNTTVANDGTFALNKLRPAEYILLAAGDGYGASNPVDIDLRETTETDVQLTLTATAPPLPATGKLHGVALKNQDGEDDMSGITIALSGTSLSASTDQDGKYALETVPPGTYQLLAQAAGFEKATASIEVTSGTDVEAPRLLLQPSRNYPKVLSVDPADGARNVPVGKQISITIRFSKDMDSGSVKQAIHIEPDVHFTVLAGKDAPDTDFNLVKVLMDSTGAEPVPQYRQRYTLTVDASAHDTENIAMQKAFAMSFTLGGAQVIGTAPGNGTLVGDLNLQNPVVIRFNAPMDSATMTRDTIRISPRLDSQPVLYVNEDSRTGWSSLYIAAIWKPDTQYRITLTTRARTLARGSLDNTPYTFSFRTAKLVPFQQPRGPRRAGDRRRNGYQSY